MSTMVVRASFPLGSFLGHRGVGRPAPFPDTARLHAALTHAAGMGSSAVERAGQLRPAPQCVAALEWLEQHVPYGLRHPPMRQVDGHRAQAWRAEGTFNVRKGVVAPRKVLKSQSDAVALGGPFEWGWRDVPDDVRQIVAWLCADVACLGESDSPVRLDVRDDDHWQADLYLDEHQSGFPTPGGLRVRSPILGRGEELATQYDQLNPAKLPDLRADKLSRSAEPGSAAPVARCVRDVVYRPVEVQPDAPWPQVVLVEVADGRLDPKASVAWCVAYHRALVSRLPESAPSMITGRFLDKAAAPANRLALHVLEPTPLVASGLDRAAFAIMIPASATAEDLAALQTALRGVRHVYGPQGHVTLDPQIRMQDADQFWLPPSTGYRRFWRPLPALVPEVRRQQPIDGRAWSLSDAAALSAAYVFRDRIPAPPPGRGRYAEIVRAVGGTGFAIHEIHAIRDSRIHKYAHKTPDGVTVQPYTGLVDLGDLAGPQTLLALGQSRHLGGGLLFPEDIAVPIARARGLQ